MTLRNRRMLYSIFIIIFLIVTPLIILYTSGYRYNFEKNKIQKTGILIIKSKPEKAAIFLNEKEQSKRTPAGIINLLPDDYNVKVRKEGFYPWQKTLTVQSQLTTFAENILLFEKNDPEKIIDGNITFFLISPDEEKIIFIKTENSSRKLWLTNIKTGEEKIIYNIPQGADEKINIEWGKDSQKILIANQKNIIVLDAKSDNADIHRSLSEFYSSFKGIENKLLEPRTLDDFLFIKSPESFTTVLNKKNKDITVFSNETLNIFWQEKAELARWSPYGNKILYLKNLELWIYDLDRNRSTLVTRHSQKIKNFYWINDSYILTLIGDTIKAIELDDRNIRNVVDFKNGESITDLGINQEEQKIFFVNEEEDNQGIFEISY